MKPVLLLCLLLFICLTSCETEKDGVAVNEERVKAAQAAKEEDTLQRIVCPVQIPCYQLPDDHSVKPLYFNKQYHGLVVLKAAIDKENMNLAFDEILFTKLRYKNSEQQYLPEPEELTKLSIVLKEYIGSVSLRRSSAADCTEFPYYYIPFNVK